MRRNDPCWCGSGVKWKNCHRNREDKPPINIFEQAEAMRRRFAQGYCLHPASGPTACSTSIIGAHTVQRRGGLALIQEQGHVLSTKPTLEDMIKHDGQPPLRRVGINNASTFPGFCNKHDTELFKPIEASQLKLDRSSALLFAFRAIAYERFTKLAAIENLKLQRQMDRGQPFWKQATIQQNIHVFEAGSLRGLHDVDNWKSEYDKCLLSNSADDFRFYSVTFDRVLPLVACTAFHSEFGFDGTALQRISRGPGPFEHVTFNLTGFDNRTVAVFGWIGEGDGPAAKFVKSFKLVPPERKADALLRMSFEHSENVFVRQSWWEALPTSLKAAYLRRMLSGSTIVEREQDCLVDDGIPILTAAVLSEHAG
jgi:hypothetical protein